MQFCNLNDPGYEDMWYIVSVMKAVSLIVLFCSDVDFFLTGVEPTYNSACTETLDT